MIANWLRIGGVFDGSGCCTLYRAMGGTDIVLASPGQNVDEIAQDLFHHFPGKIIFADIAVSVDVAKTLDARKYDLVLFDHHISSIPLKDFSWCEIEEKNQRCGSKMFFDWIKHELFVRFDNSVLSHHLNKLERYEELVNLCDDYDRWIKAYGKKTESLASLHSCLGQDLFVERFVKDSVVGLHEKEKYLIEVDRTKRERVLKQKKKDVQIWVKRIQGKERRVAFVTMHDYHNEIAEIIYNDLELNVDLVVMIGDRISFRAPERSDIDCSLLAAEFGGGGHRLAAGCALKNVLGEMPLMTVARNLSKEII